MEKERSYLGVIETKVEDVKARAARLRLLCDQQGMSDGAGVETFLSLGSVGNIP